MRIAGFIVSLLSLLFAGCIRNAEPEVFFIPQSLEGNVLILFDQKQGVQEDFQNSRLYNIPDSGIFHSKFSKPVHGKLDQKFYYLESTGNKKYKIADYLVDSVSEDEVCIMNGVYGHFSKANLKQGENLYPIDYFIFTLGQGKYKDSLQKESEIFMQKYISNY